MLQIRTRPHTWLAALAVVGAVAASPNAQRFDNCTSLLKAYPLGVARTRLAAAGTGATVDAATYRANAIRLDRDKDGVMCEQRRSTANTQPTDTGKDRQRRKAAQDRLGS